MSISARNGKVLMQKTQRKKKNGEKGDSVRMQKKTKGPMALGRSQAFTMVELEMLLQMTYVVSIKGESAEAIVELRRKLRETIDVFAPKPKE